jgi:hypothetical protein
MHDEIFTAFYDVGVAITAIAPAAAAAAAAAAAKAISDAFTDRFFILIHFRISPAIDAAAAATTIAAAATAVNVLLHQKVFGDAISKDSIEYLLI